MGRYESEARHSFGRIKYYYKHAGVTGYAQAKFHYDKLLELMSRAPGSQNGQNDVIIIKCLQEEASPLMKEMEKRQDTFRKNDEPSG